MDKLAKQLRADARRIDVSVSDELDHRIEASLRAVSLEVGDERLRPAARPPMFWWASTITGTVAAAAVIAIVNWQERDAPVTPPLGAVAAAVPTIDLNAETAVLTAPLREELDRLQSDLKKAEEKVKREIGL